MATAPETAREIAGLLDIPETTIRNVARRLGEDGLLPRGPRGRHAPDIAAVHAARILVATMALTEGLGSGAAVRMPYAVRKIGELGTGGRASVMIIPDQEGSPSLEGRGSFIDQVAQLLERGGESNAIAPYYAAVGLTFAGNHVVGWLETTARDRELSGSPDRRVYFGHAGATLRAPLAQEVRISAHVLDDLADFIWDGLPARDRQTSLDFAASGNTGAKENGSPVAASEPLQSGSSPTRSVKSTQSEDTGTRPCNQALRTPEAARTPKTQEYEQWTHRPPSALRKSRAA